MRSIISFIIYLFCGKKRKKERMIEIRENVKLKQLEIVKVVFPLIVDA